MKTKAGSARLAVPPGGERMAPGDREWREAARRREEGIPLDPATAQAFEGLAARYGLVRPPAV